MYGGQSTGIDFEKYAEIPAEATGNNVPQPITSVFFYFILFYFPLDRHCK